MADRFPGLMSDTCIRLFGRGEAFDSEGFIGFFTDNPVYQSGNSEPCFTKAAIKTSIDNFYGSIDAFYHDLRNVWEIGDHVLVEMDVIFWRKDGTSIRLPCSGILRFEGKKIQEFSIFIDANPIFRYDMKAEDKASVMTIRGGNQVKPPDTMKKYFTDHNEGKARIAAGFVPKWHIAGPKWPIRPKQDILHEFQNALLSGNMDAARSCLTDGAILRIANRPEVIGPHAIMDSLKKIFLDEVRPSNANFTGVWEPDFTSLVLEMEVDATSNDGHSIKFPCVETYRFEGNKIKELRYYPVTPLLLAPEKFSAI